MLIRFSVENFLSFNNRQEFSMIPNKSLKEKDEHLIESKYAKVLRLASIYGANAAGKSNFIKAMDIAKSIITGKITSVSNDMFCKIDKENENKASRFEFEFIKDNKCYAYGFEILLKERKFISEWLYELTDKDQSCIFERETKTNSINFNINKNNYEDEMRVKLYEIDFASEETKLLLTDSSDTKFKYESELYVLKNVYDWFNNDLIIIHPDQPIMRGNSFFEQENANKINKVIKLFDTGISKIKQEKISQEKLKKILLSEELEALNDSFKKAQENLEDLLNKAPNSLKKNLDKNEILIGSNVRINDSFFKVTGKYGTEPEISTIRTEHEKSFFDYAFSEESDGTRRLFDYLEILLGVGEDVNKVYIIDEIQRSLHPKLTYRFIEVFLKYLKGKNIQLIFTTHESAIMDQSLLRRDEIWFVERNKKNSSRIYSLDQFKERYDRKLDKSYLEGRYGAIPVFNDFSFEEEF